MDHRLVACTLIARKLHGRGNITLHVKNGGSGGRNDSNLSATGMPSSQQRNSPFQLKEHEALLEYVRQNSVQEAEKIPTQTAIDLTKEDLATAVKVKHPFILQPFISFKLILNILLGFPVSPDKYQPIFFFLFPSRFLSFSFSSLL